VPVVWHSNEERRVVAVVVVFVVLSAIVVYLHKERERERAGERLIKEAWKGGKRGAASRLINRANSGTNLKPVYMATCSKCRRSRAARSSCKK